MDSKELRGLYEAYSEVYVPQEEIEEAVKGADPEMRKASSAERRGGDKRLSPSKGKGYADQQKQQIAYMDKVTKKNKNVVGLVTKEDLDIFDVVLEFLQAEGFAETLQEAEWMMANIINEEAIAMVSDSKMEEFGLWINEAMSNYEKNRKRAAMRAAIRNDARAQGKTGAVPGVGYVTPRKERETWTDESGKTRHAKGL